MFEKLIKKKSKLNSILVILTIFALIISFIIPQVVAITPLQSKTKIIFFNKTYTSELSAEPIVFIKPVLKKMYIGDKTETSLNRNKTIIFGPITLKVQTELQSELISVKYRFIDMNNNSLSPDVEITWSENYPNFDYYYAKKHFPIFQDVLPSKFKIIATAQFIGIPYAQTNITVYKIF